MKISKVKPTFEAFLKRAKRRRTKSTAEIIRDLEARIACYEQQYEMSTEEFLPRYERGEFEMDDRYLDYELLDWWGNYQTLCRYRRGEKE